MQISLFANLSFLIFSVIDFSSFSLPLQGYKNIAKKGFGNKQSISMAYLSQ